MASWIRLTGLKFSHSCPTVETLWVERGAWMRAWGCPQTRALSSGAHFPTQHVSGLATSSQTHFSWALASGDGHITTSYFSQNESESHSVVSVSLRPHGQYSPWSSPGQNTGVGSLSLLPTGWSNPGDLPCPGIEPRSPALQAEPAKPQEKPKEVLPRRFFLLPRRF